MYFQLNLTTADHVVAAKLRIYKLPQTNITLASTISGFPDDEEEERKIRISIYYYTKSIKKHRCKSIIISAKNKLNNYKNNLIYIIAKKRLIDSVVTSLKPEGSHLALDVRQALRFWQQTQKTHGSSTNNHGLVIQVEDQDGRPLRPQQYIQQDTCHNNENNTDDKACECVR